MASNRFKQIAKEMIKRSMGGSVALRLQAIEHLGAKCRNCGTVDPRVLQIDHIDGGGTKRRREGVTPTSEYRRILDSSEGWNDEFQVLCANCNWIKRYELYEHRSGQKTHDFDAEQKWKTAPYSPSHEIYDPEVHGEFCPDEWNEDEYDEHGNLVE